MVNNSLKMSLIDQYATNFNENALSDKYDPVFYREDVTKKVIEALCRKNKRNVILLGYPGVGKTAIVESIAKMIVENNVPEILCKKKIYGIKMSALLAGTTYRGEFEERVENLLKEICNSKVILFIDEFHTIIKAGSSEGSIDFANLIKPYIARGDIQLIGATTFNEYQNSILLDKALDRRFNKITIDEPKVYITYLIIKKLKFRYESYYKILINDEAILEAINLTKNLRECYFPDKAIDLIDWACSSLVMKNEFLYSDEYIEFELQEDLQHHIKNDPLFKNIYSGIINENEKLDFKTEKNKHLEIFHQNRNNFKIQKEQNHLINAYFKEAKSMKEQGYLSKSDEIINIIIPEIQNEISTKKVELTKDFINLFYHKNYERND